MLPEELDSLTDKLAIRFICRSYCVHTPDTRTQNHSYAPAPRVKAITAQTSRGMVSVFIVEMTQLEGGQRRRVVSNLLKESLPASQCQPVLPVFGAEERQRTALIYTAGTYLTIHYTYHCSSKVKSNATPGSTPNIFEMKYGSILAIESAAETQDVMNEITPIDAVFC